MQSCINKFPVVQEKKNLEIRLQQFKKSSKNILKSVIDNLKKIFSKLGIDLIAISGRRKSLCSIWNKMNNQRLTFEDICDIFAFRVIVQDTESCYRVLHAIHKHYSYIPEKFENYISMPKNNGYKSLHTVIFSTCNKKIEIQIRTVKMHNIAEYGSASHSLYKRERYG